MSFDLLPYLTSDQTCLSFNGGKDSTAVLYLVMDTCRKFEWNLPPCIFFDHGDDEFPEVRAFVEMMVNKYNLRLITFTCSYQESMQALRDMGLHNILMGQRRDDPHCETLLYKTPVTYPGCEDMIRINPILEWKYSDVWNYLHDKDVCCLYSQGYSSLGRKSKTERHPALCLPDGTFKHARELTEGETERGFRG